MEDSKKYWKWLNFKRIYQRFRLGEKQPYLGDNRIEKN